MEILSPVEYELIRDDDRVGVEEYQGRISAAEERCESIDFMNATWCVPANRC
jgi:hypothetical protein